MSNVLLLENNNALAQVYARSLEHAGFKVTVEARAQQAIRIADIQNPM
jgi:DNA-binding response OmpR family regulator